MQSNASADGPVDEPASGPASGVDVSRRRFLTTAATVVGGAGVVAGAAPFVAAWAPSEKSRALGASVEVDISALRPGELLVTEWRGKAVWIFRRNQDMIADLSGMEDQLKDPQSAEEQQPAYAGNAVRSVDPEYFVAVGVCTHLGCSPIYVGKDSKEAEKEGLGADWRGGFYCPCHRSRFDLAGRVHKGMPAPRNLVVPPHRYLGPGRILIGEDGEVA